jgi:hypothetical protein
VRPARSPFDLAVSADGAFSASTVIRQSDWGMTPYSALFGALKVADEVEVAIDCGLVPRAKPREPRLRAIRPRALKPELLELAWISRASIEAHYKLYEGYVGKRNEILGRLMAADPSELRALKADSRSRSSGSRITRSTSSTSAATVAIRRVRSPI